MCVLNWAAPEWLWLWRLVCSLAAAAAAQRSEQPGWAAPLLAGLSNAAGAPPAPHAAHVNRDAPPRPNPAGLQGLLQVGPVCYSLWVKGGEGVWE